MWPLVPVSCRHLRLPVAQRGWQGQIRQDLLWGWDVSISARKESLAPLCCCLPSLRLKSENESRSVVSDSSWPYGLLCPWDSPGKNTGVSCHFLLQGIFSTQGLNPGLPLCRQNLKLTRQQVCPRRERHVLDFSQRLGASEGSWESLLCPRWGGDTWIVSRGFMCHMLSFHLTAVSTELKASLAALVVKNLPVNVEDVRDVGVQSLDQEDPLEKDMATHSSILAWRVPWREEPSRLLSRGSQSVRRDWSNLAHTIQPFKLLPSNSIKYFSFLLTLIFLVFSHNLTSVHFLKKIVGIFYAFSITKQFTSHNHFLSFKC